jgi:hypothetical protein
MNTMGASYPGSRHSYAYVIIITVAANCEAYHTSATGCDTNSLALTIYPVYDLFVG